ncbi:MAG TPA: MarR family transcriptional regulator [Natrialbaceae archaeon]|nr:MarR family transcriptional regulator [Natrialbaceae archaeon]
MTPPDGDDRFEEIELVADRADFLDLLVDRRLPKRDVVDELGHSRSTVNRALDDLVEAGLVDETPDGCRTTLVGRLALEEYRRYVRHSNDILAASEALATLPKDCDIPAEAIAGGTTHLPRGDRPYEPYQQAEGFIDESNAFRAAVRTFSHPSSLQSIRSVARNGNPVEIVFSRAVFDRLYADYRDLMETLVELDAFSGYVADVSECFSVLISDRNQPGGTVDTSVLIATYGAENDLEGVIVNSEPAAVRWAEAWYERYRDAALPMVDAMTDDD